jgi:hypothetical protein
MGDSTVSSRRGRRQRGRAKGWDPAAQRRANAASTYTPYVEPEDAVDDPQKIAYWRGRFERVFARSQPKEEAPDALGSLFGRGKIVANRHNLRSHGVGVRGVTRSQVARHAKIERKQDRGK